MKGRLLKDTFGRTAYQAVNAGALKGGGQYVSYYRNRTHKMARGSIKPKQADETFRYIVRINLREPGFIPYGVFDDKEILWAKQARKERRVTDQLCSSWGRNWS